MISDGHVNRQKNKSTGHRTMMKPAFVGTVTKTVYDGGSDDLLTAGLGKTGLGGAAPVVAVPAAPTAAELRRLAIFNNYRAILDISPKGGYGVLYGPNIDINGGNTLGEGKIAGTEYLAYADDGTGKQNVTLMVQVPASFDQNRPCIVTATSSGSRGVYGAIGSAGEWGLKRGCAVAYADKGTGIGVHDLATNTVNLQDGTRGDAVTAGTKSNFTAALSAANLATFNASNPNRIAIKHAHSQQNSEKDWGQNTLNAVRFAFYVLNEQLADHNPDGSTKVAFKPGNTMDRMWANLTQNVPLPPSQLVRTIPRGGTPGAAPAITTANLPPISSTPAAADQITFSNNTVTIPD
jgi:hydroxybutyrate-dimer hydrolase